MGRKSGKGTQSSRERRVCTGFRRVEGGRVIAGGLMVFVCMGTSPRVEVVIAHQGMDRKSERGLNVSEILRARPSLLNVKLKEKFMYTESDRTKRFKYTIAIYCTYVDKKM